MKQFNSYVSDFRRRGSSQSHYETEYYLITEEEAQSSSDDEEYYSAKEEDENDCIGEATIKNFLSSYYCSSKVDCKVCSNLPIVIKNTNKFGIRKSNLLARKKIKDNKSSNFYSVVGYSIIGINDYSTYHHEEKTDRLTDLIDALQSNVDRMKKLSTKTQY